MFFSSPDDDHSFQVQHKFNFSQRQKKLKALINQYLSVEILTAKLEDLPAQILHPQTRPWQAIQWHSINPKQLVGIDLELFLLILQGAINTEMPIKGYTRTSRQYIEPVDADFARFVGGVTAPDGTILELGLWEKEERQHAPALIKIYKQLSGKLPVLSPHLPKSYQPRDNPKDDLYRHGLHRIITEYGAVCLYLWLMLHTTGTLQQVVGELLQDEVNHMIKFWGFGMWLFPEACLNWLQPLRSQKHKPVSQKKASAIATNNVVNTFSRMICVLNWQRWSLSHKLELIYTFIAVSHRLWSWKGIINRQYLEKLFSASK